MQSSSILITLALLAISCVNADYSINNPVEGTTWTAGQSATVSWVPLGAGYDTATLPVTVMKGDTSALQLVANVGTASETDGSYTFNVPDSYDSGSDYVVQVGSKYSHQFTVQGGSGGGGGSSGESGGNGESGSGSASGGSGGESGGSGSASGVSGGNGGESGGDNGGSGSASGGTGGTGGTGGSTSGGTGGTGGTGGSTNGGSGSISGGVSGGQNGSVSSNTTTRLPTTSSFNSSNITNGTNSTLPNSTISGAPQLASTASMGALIPVAILALAWY